MVVALGVAAQGCILLGHDLSERVVESCNFDLVAANLCPEKSSYEVEGICQVTKGEVYSFEGRMTYDAETRKTAESYQIEPYLFLSKGLGEGEILLTVQCDADPFRTEGAECRDKNVVTTFEKMPTSFLELLNDAEPVALHQFADTDLALFEETSVCGPADPPPLPPPPPPLPICPEERRPAIFITAPLSGEVVQIPPARALTLAITTREELRTVEIQWQKVQGRGYVDQGGLPESAPFGDFPLQLALTDPDKGSGEGQFRVRVRPFDPRCDRVWSFWQEFELVGGGLELEARQQSQPRGGRRGDG